MVDKGLDLDRLLGGELLGLGDLLRSKDTSVAARGEWLAAGVQSEESAKHMRNFMNATRPCTC